MNNFNENITLEYKKRKYKINRDDSIYKEIESFETYEYTNCIAYEMAIRNEELKNEISKYNIKDLYPPRNRELKEEFGKIANEFFFDIHLHLDNIFNNNRNINNIFRPFPKKYLIKQNIDSLNNFVNHPRLKEINHSKNFISIATELSFSNYKFFILYSRPQLYIPNNLRYTLPELNLALPLDELIELVTIYKKEYEKGNKIFKTEIEVLGEKLEKATHTVKIKDVDIKIKEHLSTKDKMADLFFIYDANKLKMKKIDICNSITEYYYNKSGKESNFDNKTLNKYLDIATQYIDNLKYKELIFGIKFS